LFALLLLVAVLVGVALGAVVWFISRNAKGADSQQVPSGGGVAGGLTSDAGFDRLRPPYREFHVRGDEALVYFDAPVPAGGADSVLEALLVREAVEVVREKRSHELPIDDVTTVRAYGRRDHQDVEVGSVSLETPGQLPVIDLPPLAPHASHVTFDPLAHLVEQQFSMTPGTEAQPADAGLKSLASELTLTANTAAGLRAQGVDPAAMTATDLTLGLLRLGGYTVTPGGKEGAYVAARGGARTYLVVVDHGAGDYPELAEQTINEFMVSFATSGTVRGMLVTDKYSPFLVYDKERREPRVRFITRERLQAFVDSFSMS
jgi:hypothetical protein